MENNIQERFSYELRVLKNAGEQNIGIVTQQGESTRAQLQGRMSSIEAEFEQQTREVIAFTETVKEVEAMFKADYAEFVRDKKRWKSDFETAT
jgi:hypothetical protein